MSIQFSSAAFQTNIQSAQQPAVGTAVEVSAVRIVVPCYNEAGRLNAPAFLDFLNRTAGVSLVFVNDGSRDETLHLLMQLQSAMPDRIDVINMVRNAGKAEAVRQGLLYAVSLGADLVGYWDADLATPLDAIPDFIRVAQRFDEVEVVFGSRRQMLGHRIERTFGRRMVSRVCATLARVATRIAVSDTQCGAKLLRNTASLRVALKSPFTAGWLFDVELFTRISANIADRRRAFYEMPLHEWTEIPGSKVSGAVIAKSGIRMLRLIAENRLGLGIAETRQQGTEIQLLPASVAHLRIAR